MSKSKTNSILLDKRSGHYWQLNETASSVLELFFAGNTLIEVSAALGSVHRVDEETAREDVSALLDGLLDSKLIELVS